MKDHPVSPPSQGLVRLVLALAVLGILFASFWLAWKNGVFPDVTDQDALRSYIEAAGAWGPIITALLIAAAIIFTPVPSAPIAVAAGALFGIATGTAVVATGALLGASAAFWISRWAGYPILQKLPSARQVLQKLERDRSQNGLAVAVFVSRLIPFISFDAVSYAAGLTPLSFWRFALASLAGVLPISFVLVKVGKEAANAAELIPLTILVGLVTTLPIALAILMRRGKSGRKPR